jgi:ATP-binding cassette subfamily B protein
MLFTPKLISKSFKVIEAFHQDKTVSKAVIHEELLSNILLVIATTIIIGFLTFDATNFNNVTPH